MQDLGEMRDVLAKDGLGMNLRELLRKSLSGFEEKGESEVPMIEILEAHFEGWRSKIY